MLRRLWRAVESDNFLPIVYGVYVLFMLVIMAL